MTLKKEHIQNTLIAVLIGLFIWQFFFSDKDEKEPQPIQVIIPEQKGSTGTQIIENVKTIPIPIPGQGEVYIDEKWYNEYLAAKDSIGRLNQYLKAIEVKELDTTFIDNDTIRLDGKIKTRGSILAYKFDYNIKERVFEYKPEVVIKRPRVSLFFGVEAGIPTVPTTGFLMKGKIGLENRKGFGVSAGYDTENRVWVGLQKNIILLK